MVSNQWNEREIFYFIKKDLLVERLEMAQMGYTAENIADDVMLLDESGLGLDSVDALDLLVGVERKFGFKFGEINKEFIESNCGSLQQLVDCIANQMTQAGHTINK